MLSLVTLAVYMSASEVEVGKHISCVKTQSKTVESAETTLSLAFSQWYILHLSLFLYPFSFWLEESHVRIPSDGALKNWVHVGRAQTQEASHGFCALPVTPLKFQVLGYRLNANRILCLFCKFFKDLLVRKKRLVVLFSHWLLHAYGIISISKLDKLEQDLPLLALVPAPALFYLMTAKYTEPSRILSEGGNGH